MKTRTLLMQAWPGFVLLLLLISTGTAASTKPEGLMETVRLPQPRTDSTVSVERALQLRRSVRNFSASAITMNEIAQLLWSAQGITHAEGLRTAPSAGALYPLEIILVAGRVDGLEPAIYRYSPARHELTVIAAGDRRIGLVRAALGQQWVQKAAAVIVFCAVEKRTTRKYGNRGVAYVYIEVGHAAQNVFLQAQALGLGAAVVGAFDEAQTASLLQLSNEQKPLYLMPVGKPEQ